MEEIGRAFTFMLDREDQKLSQKDIKAIVDKVDENGDGFIDISEWHAVALSRSQMISENNLKWAF